MPIKIGWIQVINKKRDSILVGCVLTAAVASTSAGCTNLDTLDSWIHYTPDTYPWVYLTLWKGPGSRDAEIFSLWDQRYPTPERTWNQWPGKNLGPQIPYPPPWADKHLWKYNLPLQSVITRWLQHMMTLCKCCYTLYATLIGCSASNNSAFCKVTQSSKLHPS